MTARRVVIAQVLRDWAGYDDETRHLAGPLADLIDDALDVAGHEPGPVKVVADPEYRDAMRGRVVRPDPSRAYEEVRVPGLIPWLRRRRRARSTGSASFPPPPTEIPSAALGTYACRWCDEPIVRRGRWVHASTGASTGFDATGGIHQAEPTSR